MDLERWWQPGELFASLRKSQGSVLLRRLKLYFKELVGAPSEGPGSPAEAEVARLRAEIERLKGS
jgi:hypothetical protein